MTLSLLALAFFVTALLYSSVGFGGGSTYNALLALGAVSLATVPVVALVCNILVVSLGSWRFMRAGHVYLRHFWPLALLSVPAAWLGGYLPVPPWLFIGLLALALGIAGLLMLWSPLWMRESLRGKPASRGTDLASGAGLGLIAGITGIGGGIYLAPLLHLRRWGSSREIAGTSALFILVNSVSGLAGQVTKLGPTAATNALTGNWPLFVAVVAGGAIGSSLGAGRIKEQHMRVLTALLILYVAVRLGLRFPVEWARR